MNELAFNLYFEELMPLGFKNLLKTHHSDERKAKREAKKREIENKKPKVKKIRVLFK